MTKNISKNILNRFLNTAKLKTILYGMLLFMGLIFLAVQLYTVNNYSSYIYDRNAELQTSVIKAMIQERLVFHHKKEALAAVEKIAGNPLFRNIFITEDPSDIKSQFKMAIDKIHLEMPDLNILEMLALSNDYRTLGSWQSPEKEHVSLEKLRNSHRLDSSDDMLTVDSHFTTSVRGCPVHTLIFPIGGSVKNYGYLVFITSPLASLKGMGKFINAEVDIKNIAGETIVPTQYKYEEYIKRESSSGWNQREYETIEIPILGDNDKPFMKALVRYDNIAALGLQNKLNSFSILMGIMGAWISWIIVSHVFNISLFKRISEISHALAEIGKGTKDVKLPDSRDDELFVLWEQLKNVIVYEEDQRKLTDALIKARKEADISNQAKSEFLANMSHELRTPLNAIIGFSEILTNKDLPPQLKNKTSEYAHDIRSSGVHLLNIINDILDLSKIESGNMSLSKEKMDIHEIINMALRMVQEAAHKKSITIENMTSANQPILLVDCRMTQQAIINIISNAVKFTLEKGTIVINAGLDNHGEFCIAISDTGIGISEDQIKLVTSPFNQVDSSYTREQEGTGLGLALVKGFMELHEGTLRLDSVIGVGTTVYLTFPKSCILSEIVLQKRRA